MPVFAETGEGLVVAYGPRVGVCSLADTNGIHTENIPRSQVLPRHIAVATRQGMGRARAHGRSGKVAGGIIRQQIADVFLRAAIVERTLLWIGNLNPVHGRLSVSVLRHQQPAL